MVLPDPVDAKILPGKALALETSFLQQPDRRDVGWDAGGFDPMQLQRPECKGNDGVDRGRHVTLARIGCSHPVAEAARLRATAANISERQSAQEHIVVPAENEKRIGEIAALVFRITLDATAKGRAREVVGGPRRLPRREEVAACFAQ